jgi:hypothetical protein
MPTNQHLRHKRPLDTAIETLVSGRLPFLFNISSNSLGLTSSLAGVATCQHPYWGIEQFFFLSSA